MEFTEILELLEKDLSESEKIELEEIEEIELLEMEDIELFDIPEIELFETENIKDGGKENGINRKQRNDNK